MIRNCIFRSQSLEICYFWVRINDSRRFQLAIYTVFHEESESAVRIDRFLHPEEKIKKNQPTRVSISYRKISYYTSPPYWDGLKNFSLSPLNVGATAKCVLHDIKCSLRQHANENSC